MEAFEPLFYPKSLAIIGASAEPTKFGNIILSAIKEIGYGWEIYPVNPEGGEIQGMKVYPSLKEIPGEVDFAIISLPAPLVVSALEECLRKGVQGVAIITSGFKETGSPEGRNMEEELSRIARQGIRILGPNCFGVYCPESGFTIMPGHNFSRKTGTVGIFSQRGGRGAGLRAIS